MTYQIEKYVSNFIKNQLPAFYDEEGPNFILFLQAYYEWLEQDGLPVGEARRLFEYRDIDTTLEAFLIHFQEKYLYGIPFSIISNKRFLLKHILDIYRSKGTTRAYELLFKLIYDQDIEVYYPREDILKASDGTWKQPRYLELTDNENIDSLLGQQIVGSVSGTLAIVEKINRQPVNGKIVAVVYISNIEPRGADFRQGERIMLYPTSRSYSLFDAPTVIGSLQSIEVLSGGDGFTPGDILKIAERDVDTGNIATIGSGGSVKVTETSRSQGTLQFYITASGFGYNQDSSIFFYNEIGDNSGKDGGFDIGPISNIQNMVYNTDLVVDYLTVQLNALSFGFPNNSVMQTSTLEDAFNYANQNFGSIFTLTNIRPGNNYIAAPAIHVQSSLLSRAMAGTIRYSSANVQVITAGSITYNTGANTVTGSGTTFSTIFTNGDVIALKQSNSSTSYEYHIINAVTSNTSLQLMENPSTSSTATSKFYKVPYIVGTGTDFANLLSTEHILTLKANNVLANTVEEVYIREVVNNTLVILYGAPVHNSTGTSAYYLTPTIMTSNWALYDPDVAQADGTTPGENGIITAVPNSGNNIVSAAVAYDSGFGYQDNEVVKCYFFNCLTNPRIVSGGLGYANGEYIEFVGGTTSIQANAFVTTNATGGVVGITMVNPGANYTYVPTMRVNSANTSANGAEFATTIAPPDQFNTVSFVLGRVVKGGVGVSPGYWSTTRGMLNEDKYLTDSYFYQDYSYEIKVAATLDKYRDIIYNTFHSSGMELFGSFLSLDKQYSNTEILYELSTPITVPPLAVDNTYVYVDSTVITADETHV